MAKITGGTVSTPIPVGVFATKEQCDRIQYYGSSDIVPSSEDLFNFEVNDETMTASVSSNGVTSEHGQLEISGDIVIPYRYIKNGKSYTVTEISSGAFDMGVNITSIIIPNSVKVIGIDAFGYCYGLTAMEIPNGVTTINDRIFSDCYNLRSVTIPDSVTSIGLGAFYGCYGLTQINIPSSVVSIHHTAFEECISLTTFYCEQGSFADDFASSKGYEVVYTTINKDAFNKENVPIVQTTGASKTDVMSQKAVTDAITENFYNNMEITSNSEFEIGKTILSDGALASQMTMATSNFISVISSNTLTNSSDAVDLNAIPLTVMIATYDANKTFLERITIESADLYNHLTYFDSDVSFIRIVIGRASSYKVNFVESDLELFSLSLSVNKLDALERSLEESGKQVADLAVLIKSKNLLNLNDEDFVNKGYIDLSGNMYVGDGTQKATGYIPVSAGQVIKFAKTDSAKFVLENSMSKICAYNANKEPIQSSGTSSVTSYTVPDGISYIRVSGWGFTKSANPMIYVDDGTVTEYEAYFKPYMAAKNVTDKLITKEKLSDDVNNIIIYGGKIDVDFESGAILADGAESNNEKRVRSDYIPVADFCFNNSDDIKYLICYYDAEKQILNRTSFKTESSFIDNVESAEFIRIVIGYIDESTINTYAAVLECKDKLSITNHYELGYVLNYVDTAVANVQPPTDEEDLEPPLTEYTSVIPENVGVLNAIMNFKQLTNIRYKTKAKIPVTQGSINAATTYAGLPYSSTRPEALFVPNNVSLHTFMTSLQNPNSYLYTVDLGELGNENGDTYYGAVCSTACGYALGITPTYSTHQWETIPGMRIIKNPSADKLKLCDTIVGNGHVVMITDITKNSEGEIGEITISEAYPPRCRNVKYTPTTLEQKYPPSTYKYCRYSKLYAVKHEQSPFVAVEDEIPQIISYNENIIPRKGDKANWLQGVDVVLDVLKPESYTSVEIYKDDVLLESKDIADVITLSGLTYGSYKARLTNGTNNSKWCYWMVVDAVSSATPLGSDGKIEVTFSASNAVPVYVLWSNGTTNGTVNVSIPTESEFDAGKATCAYEAGSYKIRVGFKTDYGIIFSELADAIDVL